MYRDGLPCDAFRAHGAAPKRSSGLQVDTWRDRVDVHELNLTIMLPRCGPILLMVTRKLISVLLLALVITEQADPTTDDPSRMAPLPNADSAFPMEGNNFALCITGSMRTLPELATLTNSRIVKPWHADVILVLQLGNGQKELGRLRHVAHVLAPSRTVGYLDESEISSNSSDSASSWCVEPACSLQSSPKILGGYPLAEQFCQAKLRRTPTFYLMSVKRATCLAKIVELESATKRSYLGVAFMRPDIWVPIRRATNELMQLLQVNHKVGVWIDSCIPLPVSRQQSCASWTRPPMPKEPRCEVAHDWLAVTTRQWAHVYASAGNLLLPPYNSSCANFSHQCSCHGNSQSPSYQLTQMCLLTLWLRIHRAPFTQFPSMGPFAFAASAGSLPKSVAIDPAKVKTPTLKHNVLGDNWDTTRGYNGECTLYKIKPSKSSDTQGTTPIFHKSSIKYTLSRWLECPVEDMTN